jgi:hypothetical protein
VTWKVLTQVGQLTHHPCQSRSTVKMQDVTDVLGQCRRITDTSQGSPKGLTIDVGAYHTAQVGIRLPALIKCHKGTRIMTTQHIVQGLFGHAKVSSNTIATGAP